MRSTPPAPGHSSPCDGLARVDRLWRCTGCGYFAYSSPWLSIYDDEGNEVGGDQHVCPGCGEKDWHWCGGDSREKRIGYAQEIGRVSESLLAALRRWPFRVIAGWMHAADGSYPYPRLARWIRTRAGVTWP